MSTLIGTTIAMLVLAGPAWSQTMSQSEIASCNATWTSLEGNKTGSVTQAQAQSAVKTFSSVDTNKDGKLSKAEFTEACRKGLVTPTKAK
jgi:Ca2+-binding EF-hand superfamily protein